MDTVTLSGTPASLLQVSAAPATLTTNQNTPATFAATIDTSLADTYTVAAQRRRLDGRHRR